jgi:hypothetical protein
MRNSIETNMPVGEEDSRLRGNDGVAWLSASTDWYYVAQQEDPFASLLALLTLGATSIAGF